MTVTAAPALRTALHLLLALCLLLQGATSAAMASAMAMAGTAQDASAPSHPARDASALPPCHAPPASDLPPADGAMATGKACCDAAGGLCQWACAQAPTLPTLALRLPVLGIAARPVIPPVTSDLPWPTATPLRPPIA